MTDKEKLQKLFEAALRSPEDVPSGPPKRAFPTPVIETAADDTSMVVTPAQVVAPAYQAAPQPVVVSAPAVAEAPPHDANPAPVATLDAAAAEELGQLLDEELGRRARRQRLQSVITVVVLLGMVAGGAAWFMQDAARLRTAAEAVRDVRSLGDAKGLAAKYDDALDRVATRSQQIDEATAAIGAVPGETGGEDPHFNEEMKAMMGSEGGRTTSERDKLFKQVLGNRVKNGSKLGSDGLTSISHDLKDPALDANP